MNKAFLEITNVCNLACDFCHGTKRVRRYMSRAEFEYAAHQLRQFAEYLYFHLMGEPLLHPELSAFFDIAHALGFKVILTTNGTLLHDRADVLLSAESLYKVSISLHCYEANNSRYELESYLDECFCFCQKAAERGIISVMRLWNIGGEDKLNQKIIARMHSHFDGDSSTEWKQIYSGYKIRDKVFLEWGERFEWPDAEAEYIGENISCYGLRDQIGVLCDGTVVPCCLDADGTIELGNIFKTPLSEILSSERAAALKRSFEIRRVKEPLCQSCGYAHKKNY
ncbi:MAG: SPASM domain-containing protein [Clostridia bacterium]|nr:SPASM domain-containing protein [Clostridia bacterium]